MKTLIGKENYLFLQNDANKELEVHNNNLCNVNPNSFRKYEKYLEKYLIIVFPNKSLVHKNFLPDQYDLKYRPAFDLYRNYFGERILDLYPHLSEEDTYYKTDTHMNFLGAYLSYRLVVDRINELFQLQIERLELPIRKKECVLMELGLGIGDLTWEMNLGSQTLENKTDMFYFAEEVEPIMNTYKIGSDARISAIYNYELVDETAQHLGQVIDWNIVSKYILHTVNEKVGNRKKIVVFYDSFLLSSLSLWMQSFYEVYFIKSTFIPQLVDRINPDYILEFRVERFLS